MARIVIEGEMVLQTPAHLGNGDGAAVDESVDMMLLLDPFAEAGGSELPLLTGSSIAGALRGYLREREQGYFKSVTTGAHEALLFGGAKGRDDGEQSLLIIEDSIGTNGRVELRDGVRIERKTRTAADHAKFDLQLWEAGAIFPLRFELAIDEQARENGVEKILRQMLATALAGLAGGEITLGARKRRGYGRVGISRWWLREYHLTNSEDLLAWIREGGERIKNTAPISTKELTEMLGGEINDKREHLRIEANFSLDGSLLIRSGGGRDDQGPDMIHLHSRQADGRLAPIISGTSLAGAIGSRIEAIVNTLINTHNGSKTAEVVGSIFGNTGRASRLIVSEQPIRNGVSDLVQNRVGIDRFTGGARETALFNQQPVFGGDETSVMIIMTLVNPADHEIGLLLLALKDLWTGDLPLGGERSVGRGRLRGRYAIISLAGAEPASWELNDEGGRLQVTGDEKRLNDYVSKSLRNFFQIAA